MPGKKSQNITRVAHQVSTAEREVRYRHTGGVLWFTGLSGSGKSTLAFALEECQADLFLHHGRELSPRSPRRMPQATLATSPGASWPIWPAEAPTRRRRAWFLLI